MLSQDKQIKTDIFDLQPLFDKAVKEGLWFHSSYQDLWFSPSELHKEQQAGRFRWGSVNWTLRHPHERMSELLRRLREAEDAVAQFRRRISG